MEKRQYFIAFTWKNMQSGISFGNRVIDEFPLQWLKKEQDRQLGKEVRLLWWKQLTDKDEIEAAKAIGQTAF